MRAAKAGAASVLLVAAAVAVLVLPARSSSAERIRAAAAGAALSLDPSSLTVTRGDTLTVHVRLSNSGDPVNAVEADLAYPASVLRYDHAEVNGSAWGITAANTGGSGEVSVQVASLTPVSGDQLIASVTFTASASGTACVSFASTSAVADAATNEDTLGSTSGGTYTVPGADDTSCAEATPGSRGGSSGGPSDASSQSGTTAHPAVTRASVRLLGWRGRALHVRLRCPSSASSNCQIAMSLRTKAGKTLKRATTVLARGHALTATIELPAATVRRLHRQRTRLRLVVKTTTSRGTASRSTAVAAPSR